MTKVKIEKFQAKKVKIENFELQKRYMSQNKAENIYNSVSAQKTKNFCKKKKLINFSDFRDMLEDPLKFSMFNFSKISKKIPKMALLGSIKH